MLTFLDFVDTRSRNTTQVTYDITPREVGRVQSRRPCEHQPGYDSAEVPDYDMQDGSARNMSNTRSESGGSTP